MVTTPFVDLFDPSTFVAGVPHEYFAWLRANDPVRFHPEPEGPGFWAVTRHTDVLAVSRDPATFSSHAGSALIFDVPEMDLDFMRRQLIHMDPPQHSKLRGIVKTGFTPRHVTQLEARIVEFAREIVNRVSALGECDFVTEVAAELPLLVLAEILGVPASDRHMLFDWSNRLIGLDDPEYQQHGSADMSARIALVEMFQYAHELAEEKRRAPTDDIVSTLVTAEVDGERLDDIDFNMFFFLLVIAGNETTRNALSGGLWALHEHPDERRRLLEDRALMPTAVEEMLRWVTPVIEFRRTATCDTHVGEQAVSEGDKVVVYYPSANRDEAVFDGAERFDVGRNPNPHLAFGFGTHFCLGSNLARLELRVLFDELLTRLPDIEATAPPSRLRSNFINGIKHLPVAFTPAQP
jgi:cholest-4-en-3-one 26-monooxygenase